MHACPCCVVSETEKKLQDQSMRRFRFVTIHECLCNGRARSRISSLQHLCVVASRRARSEKSGYPNLSSPPTATHVPESHKTVNVLGENVQHWGTQSISTAAIFIAVLAGWTKNIHVAHSRRSSWIPHATVASVFGNAPAKTGESSELLQ